jgi:hypothetical protein
MYTGLAGRVQHTQTSHPSWYVPLEVYLLGVSWILCVNKLAFAA